ncbi:MAG: Rrf2 family transcriptional regulator [Chitinophagaceae bacterium]|nr:Rrf2 family transcriptional regulator [Chitinophagaceae bacterium]
MLSQKAKYALQALAYLGSRYEEEKPVLISQIAQEKKIPLKFLETILNDLKKAEVLQSVRGRAGGYLFKQHPSKTNVAHIMRIIDGPIALLSCVSLNFYKACDNCDQHHCRIGPIMSEARDAILQVLEKRTLWDLKDE